MDMLTHTQIWTAIDTLAKLKNMSTSGLAKFSGLDPTSFNPSKRFTNEGRERWPSTESIAKILKRTNTTVTDFMALVEHVEGDAGDTIFKQSGDNDTLPLIGFAQAGFGGFFDDGGFPTGHGWDQIVPPYKASENAYALKVSGDSMLPLYREGDVIIIDPNAKLHVGDRVVAKTTDGEIFAKSLEKKTTREIRLKSLNPDYEVLVFAPNDLEWLARIVWASQ